MNEKVVKVGALRGDARLGKGNAPWRKAAPSWENLFRVSKGTLAAMIMCVIPSGDKSPRLNLCFFPEDQII